MTDATEELLRRSSKLLFYPQKGPQEDLLKFKGVPEVLFGGARGGGKTAALLGDFVSDVSVYKSHWIGVLFRRTYPELEEVIRQSFEFYPQTGASYNANEKCWKWPNGAKLYLRYMAHPRDATNYQGHQFCLALGEKVATSTGPKAIEELKVGDFVVTGSGYHRVTWKTTPIEKPCVRATVEGGKSQIHPFDHKILGKDGWVSYETIGNQPFYAYQIDRWYDGGVWEYSADKYIHPYTQQSLGFSWNNRLVSCYFEEVGIRPCVDIEVETTSSYVSDATGLLNKNCWIGFDELGNFATDEGYTQMIACLRSPHDVPHKRIRATANPGGVGHGWVKARFEIAEHPTGYKLIENETGLHRMFIPSRVTDNQILLKADPNYVQRLHDIGSPEMVRAWLHGDWDVVAGAYFPEFSQEHVIDSIEPDDLPQHWKIYRAYDHGTYHPFAVLWYTYAGEDWRGIKKGSIVILREWYGGNDKDEGLKLSLVDIRDGIVDREASIRRRVEPGPADNQIFENNGGQSIADALAIAGIYFSRSDKARIPGWNQIRMRLREHTLLITRNCRHLLRTFPMLQHDDSKPEDVDTDGADHLIDVARYISMQWPVIPRFDKKKKRGANAVTYNDLVEAVDDVSNRWRI